MSNLDNSVLFDRRLLSRHIKAGDVAQKEVDTMLDSLPDMAENVEYINAAALRGAASSAATSASRKVADTDRSSTAE